MSKVIRPAPCRLDRLDHLDRLARPAGLIPRGPRRLGPPYKTRAMPDLPPPVPNAPPVERPPALTKAPPAGRLFPCAACGAKVEFDPRSRTLKCPYCGHTTTIPDADGDGVVE